MKKIIIEVGSTITKVDILENNTLKRINEKSIFFKKNYKENNKLVDNDIKELITLVNSYRNNDTLIFVCGTSVFRDLNDEEKNVFLNNFKKETSLDFKIISNTEENELTCLGATRNIKNKKVCVFIGGGGSTEISIIDNSKITLSKTSNIGVIDVMNYFKDLNDDYATSSIDEIKDFIKENLSLPNEQCDTLILAGGAHEKFINEANLKHEMNTLYTDPNAPFQMDNITRTNETKRFMYEISLNEIKNRVEDPDWWYGARMMCIFILVVMENINAKIIIPTNISMSYGIVEKYLR